MLSDKGWMAGTTDVDIGGSNWTGTETSESSAGQLCQRARDALLV